MKKNSLPQAATEVDARTWLRANGYADVADQIDAVIAQWHAQRKRTRRNWWEILAGDQEGNQRMAGGHIFPILRTARIRQRMPDVPDALCRNPAEQPPPLRVTGRWPKRKRKQPRR